MSGYELTTSSYNPFAYQTPPLKTGTGFVPAHKVHSGETGTGFTPAQYAFGTATVPVKKAVQSNEELLTQEYDKNFIKNTFAYAGSGHPSLVQPEERAIYDDSDYRGLGVYCAA